MSYRAKRIATVLGSILLLGVGWYAFFWPKPLPPPDESRRVNHPAGYSLIVPEGFEGSTNVVGDGTYSDWIHGLDTSYTAGSPTIGVRRFRSVPDRATLSDQGYKFTDTFQGHEAIVFNGPRGRGKLSQWNWRMVVKIEGDWFELYATDLQLFDYHKHIYKRFLESFAYQPVTSAATQPAPDPIALPATRGS